MRRPSSTTWLTLIALFLGAICSSVFMAFLGRGWVQGTLGYAGGFVQHYIGPVGYPRGMPRQLELVAGVSIVAGNALVYAIVLAWAGR